MILARRAWRYTDAFYSRRRSDAFRGALSDALVGALSERLANIWTCVATWLRWIRVLGAGWFRMAPMSLLCICRMAFSIAYIKTEIKVKPCDAKASMAIGLKSTFTTWSSAATQRGCLQAGDGHKQTQALKAEPAEFYWARLASSSPSELVPQPRFNALRSCPVTDARDKCRGSTIGIEAATHWRWEAQAELLLM